MAVLTTLSRSGGRNRIVQKWVLSHPVGSDALYLDSLVGAVIERKRAHYGVS